MSTYTEYAEYSRIQYTGLKICPMWCCIQQQIRQIHEMMPRTKKSKQTIYMNVVS